MSNKYQEALDNIMDWLHPEYHSTFKDEFNTLQELVDKETPMKPIVKELRRPDGKGGKEFWQYLYQCPTCEENYKKNGFIHHFNSLEKGISYCSHCGQHIDWSDIRNED